jgi:hypothetical protein
MKTLLDRIFFHKERQSKSNFSIGYTTALEDPNTLRTKLSNNYYKKNIDKYSSKKHLSNNEKQDFEYSKGYRAAVSDLKK